MATNFAFVPHAAQRHAHKVASRGFSDGAAKRSLADARRAHEAEYRSFHLAGAFLHGEIFQDPLFHLVETIMVVIKLLLGLGEIGLDFLARAPRQGQQPVEIIPHDSRFRRHWRHLTQLLDLGFGLQARLFRQRGIRNLLLKVGQLVALSAIAALLAQLALNRFHLLVQVIFALGLLHLPLDAVLDLPLHLQHAHFAFHEGEDLLEAIFRIGKFEQFLLFGEFDRQVRRHRIGQTTRLGQRSNRGDGFRRDLAVQLDVIFKLLLHGTHECLHVIIGALGLVIGFDFSFKIFAAVVQLVQTRTRLAFDQHFHRTVRQLEQLQNGGNRADLVDII